MPKTVLLADDSITIQHAVGISLANEDIALINVGNGEDALIKARAVKPDLILLDVVMPKISGYDVCKQIRQDPAIKHTPIIMMVGAIEGFDENKFKEAMANDYIIKPFETGALINKVRKYLYPELSRPVAAQPSFKPAPATEPPKVPVTQPPKVQVPQIPVQPQPVTKTNPQIPVIPPKPSQPPVVPPTIPNPFVSQPPTPPVKPVDNQSAFVAPPIPPMPPHIPITETAPQTTSAPKESAPVTDFINNLISPATSNNKAKATEQEMVDEISPQEIEEITSDIPELEGKPQQEQLPSQTPPAVIDIVSQVDQSIPQPEPPKEEARREEPSFNMDDWGVELKKEIMEASGLTQPEPKAETPPEVVKEAPVEETKTQIPTQESVAYSPTETEPAPMQVVTIAESITTEKVGDTVKPVEVSVEPAIPSQIEPTSLVEPKIPLSQNLNEETMKQIKDTIERVVWEIVPELAEKLIKAEIKRLMSEKEE